MGVLILKWSLGQQFEVYQAEFVEARLPGGAYEAE
jgi:hypothetical protein